MNKMALWGNIVQTILAVVGIFVLLVYIGQLRTMKRTLDEIRRGGNATHDLALAAGKQADAAKAVADSTKQVADQAVVQTEVTNRLAKDAKRAADAAERAIAASIEADRPWMGLSEIRGVGELKAETPITLELRFVNAGKRPARVVASAFEVRSYTEFPKTPSYGARFMDKPTGVVMPNIVYSISFTLRISESELKNILEHRVNEYFYGFVSYEDAKTKQIHTTHACQLYHRIEKRLSMCETYNDSD